MLRWRVSDGVLGYTVSRGLPGRDMIDIGAVPGPSFMDHDLRPGTRYVYRVTEMRPDDYVPTDVDDVDLMRTTATTLPELEFADRTQFFREFLAKTFARKPGKVQWCPEWQSHDEAFYVVGELWNSYEASRPADPPGPPDGGRMAWLVHYAYPALDRLFLEECGFCGCEQENVHDGKDFHQPQVAPLPG